MGPSQHAEPSQNVRYQRLRARVAQLEEKFSRIRNSSASNESVVTLIHLMENAPVGFAFLNADFRYEVVNHRLAEMHGVPVSSHLGRTVEEIAPHLAAQERQAFQEVIATGQPLHDVELSGEMANEPGVLRHWSASWCPMHAADGRLLGVGAVIAEITEHKRALEALRTNQHRFELAQAATGIGWWEWDLRTNEVNCSQEYGRLCGLPPAEIALPYENWLDLVHPEDRERMQQDLAQALAGLEEYRSEFRVVWPHGTIHWLSSQGRVVRDAAGTATHVLSLNVDINERKQGEQVVRESEQRFRKMADDAPVMICASGPDQLATFFNEGWLNFTGCTLEQELGRGWTERIHPEDRDRALAEIAASFEARRYCCVEYRLRRADGEYRWMLCHGAPRCDPDGRFTGYVGSAIDITDLKRSHEEALAMQKLESIGVLAGGVAHDFNNLLSSILAESELLEVALSSDPAALQGVARIKLVASRAAAIVRELLAYSGEETVVFRPVDISALVAEMVDFLRVSISKRATFEVNLPRNLVAVRANPSQIWQVILNLITNASEALGEHGGTITLTTATARITSDVDLKGELPEGDYVRLEVKDTGVGMTEEVRTRIFDPFFSTKFSGRGLGLAVVQGIVRRHGGGLRVSSTPGQGSRFEVLLPAILEPATEADDVVGVRSDSQAADHLAPILLVEDETSLRVPVAKMLQKRGYSVIEADDGLAAIEIFRARAPEIRVVLLDMTLPGASGTEVLVELSRLRPNVKVIVTTAYSQEKALIDLCGHRPWAFIRKPYRLGDLVNLLQQALL